jgi:hypothetical protein
VPNILEQYRSHYPEVELTLFFIISGLQNLRLKGVVYRSLGDDFPKLKLALAWRKAESAPVVQEFLKITKATVHPIGH